MQLTCIKIKTFEFNTINYVKLFNLEEFIDLILTFIDYFPSRYHFETHFGFEQYDEFTQPNEYFSEEIRLETIKFKPEYYPCFYVFVPINIDSCREFGGASGWLDGFIYD